MKSTNVKLSTEELRLVTNAEIILTKNRIIEKVQLLFGQLSEISKVEFEGLLPAAVAHIAPKIYKGEQYQKLPYVLMDYPRYFKKDEVFAVRSLFWWGNFFSVTIHTSGRFKQLVTKAVEGGQFNEWLLDIGEDEWDHRLSQTQLLKSDIGLLQPLSDWPFIKLSKKIPLREWDSVSDFFIERYKEIARRLPF